MLLQIDAFVKLLTWWAVGGYPQVRNRD
jgi:hypothetical protein